jgi:hypothetical protein
LEVTAKVFVWVDIPDDMQQHLDNADYPMYLDDFENEAGVTVDRLDIAQQMEFDVEGIRFKGLKT